MESMSSLSVVIVLGSPLPRVPGDAMRWHGPFSHSLFFEYLKGGRRRTSAIGSFFGKIPGVYFG